MERLQKNSPKKVIFFHINFSKKSEINFLFHFFPELLCLKLDEEAKINQEARSVTGAFALHPRSRDIKVENFSITFFGAELLQDTMLELNCGRRYGLIGINGCGKSSLLSVLGNREVPIPEHIDIFHLTREIPASSKTALQCVMEVDEERIKLEKLADRLATCEDDESQDQLMDVYERLDDMAADQVINFFIFFFDDVCIKFLI